ncbi:unnamed protein product [Orchesella dallaii]|uniref:Uncharacterized protein n=1 Tax=Orchesella dallaii TaxID=48710 RepID=A0ABP1PX14_9HEXA
METSEAQEVPEAAEAPSATSEVIPKVKTSSHLAPMNEDPASNKANDEPSASSGTVGSAPVEDSDDDATFMHTVVDLTISDGDSVLFTLCPCNNDSSLPLVLKIPHEKLCEFIGFEEGANHPELWVNVCDSCKPVVQEFYEILREVSKKTKEAGDVSDLEERLNEIDRDLKGKIFESRNKKCENYIWEQIREHVLKDDVMEKKSEVRISVAVQNHLPPSPVSSSTTPVFQRETSPAVADVVPLNEDRNDEGQIQPGDIEPRRLLNEKFQKINNQILAKARENIKHDEEEEETDESSHGGSDDEIEVTSDCEEEEDSAVDLNQPENLTFPVIVQDSKDIEGGREDQIKASGSASQITQPVPGAAELRRRKRKIVRRMIT